MWTDESDSAPQGNAGADEAREGLQPRVGHTHGMV